MQLIRKLLIAGDPYKVVEEDVRLDLHSPGRANFTIASKPLPKGVHLVDFRIGYAKLDKMYHLFDGYVERTEPIDNRHLKVFCRERTAALRYPLPMNLRHVSLRDVLARVSKETGLVFSTQEKEYATRKLPNVYNLGNGYQLMDSLGKALAISRYLWQQQSNGTVFVGSWNDSFWAEKSIQIPAQILTEHRANNIVRMMAIPALRPGVLANERFIHQLRFFGNEMEIQWTRQFEI
uniref:Uncharacterized protein n=1 Tax=Candidatus Kentrum sp. LFY TaxID=2126342 RepID=A0A450WI13_9GAMM|nr:MAG: hypothetical protein BECKLFY1418C_GA0070996_102514 [Candidatus Kentron sp. LFY]